MKKNIPFLILVMLIFFVSCDTVTQFVIRVPVDRTPTLTIENQTGYPVVVTTPVSSNINIGARTQFQPGETAGTINVTYTIDRIQFTEQVTMNNADATVTLTRRPQQQVSQEQVQQQLVQQQVPSQIAQATPTSQPASQFWVGDGGRGMSIAILTPRSSGLSDNQNHLPIVVQGEMVSNFSSFSAIRVLDRENLQEQYAELLSGHYEDDAEELHDLGRLPPTDYLMSGSITRTSTGYALQMRVTRNVDKMIVASHSETCTFAELDNLTAIRRASLDLLEKMGIRPTARTRTELTRAAPVNHVEAQSALSRGIIAQRQGTEVAALSYFLQAADYDPSLEEAAIRLNNLTKSIISGNMGVGVQNDIQWRNQWIERLRETENFITQYLKEIPAFYFVYPSSSDKWEIEYEGTTITLSMELSNLPEPTWFETINKLISTIRSGLLATDRADSWRLNWPAQSITRPSPIADMNNAYPIVVEILNARGVSLGRQTANFRFGWFIQDGHELLGTIAPYIQFGAKISFPRVDPNAITDNLSVRINSINGVNAESGVSQMGICVLPQNDFDNIQSIIEKGLQINNLRQYDIRFDQNRNLLRGYSGNNASIDIPWGVTVIDKDSGLSNRGLISVTIPSSVTKIDGSEFGKAGAFEGNRLTSIIIPDSITSIAVQTFNDNPLTSVSIGANVRLLAGLLYEAFPNRFNRFYGNNGQKAGTYTYDGNNWTYRGQ